MDLGFLLITQMKRKVGNTYPLRYARPPTLGGQPHPVAYGPSEEFSAFGPSGRRCSPLRGDSLIRLLTVHPENSPRSDSPDGLLP